MKKYFVSIYCPPYPPKVEKNVPNRITRKSFEILKNVGIDNIFGHFEDSYGDNYIDDSMSLCDEYGMSYFIRPQITHNFLEVTDSPVFKGTSFKEKSIEEQEKLLNEFSKTCERYAKHKSFGGVMFGDESPLQSFEGLGAAYKLFKEKYPNKDFHYNCLNYCISDAHMYGGAESKFKDVMVGDLAIASENRFNRYNYFLSHYFEKTGLNMFSTDLYPFSDYWKELNTSIHRGLYEIPGYMAELKKKRPGLKTYSYIQLGVWDDVGDKVKVDFPEMSLQINIAMAFNCDGYVFFPGVTPNDFIGDPAYENTIHGKMGFIDDQGNETKYVNIVKPIIEYSQKVAPILLESQFQGVYTIGEFKSGFPKNVDVAALVDNDAIYTGKLNNFVIYEGNKPEIVTNGQLLVSIFSLNNKPIYFITNNSRVSDVEFTIFSELVNCLIQSGKRDGNKFNLKSGTSVLIY